MPRHMKLALGLVALAASLTALPLSAVAAPAPQETKSKGAAEAGHPADGASDLRAANGAAPAHGEAAGRAGAEAKPDIMEPQPSLAIWTLVVFLGLMAVLGKFAWKPLLDALHRREEHLEHVLAETERARDEGERLLSEHRSRLAAAENEIRAMLDGARADAQSRSDEMLKKAQSEVDGLRDRAGREISTAKDQALSELWNQTADLAVSVAGKVLGKSMTEDDHRRLVEAAVGELPAVAAANGKGSARGGVA